MSDERARELLDEWAKTQRKFELFAEHTPESKILCLNYSEFNNQNKDIKEDDYGIISTEKLQSFASFVAKKEASAVLKAREEERENVESNEQEEYLRTIDCLEDVNKELKNIAVREEQKRMERFVLNEIALLDVSIANAKDYPHEQLNKKSALKKVLKEFERFVGVKEK